MKYQRLVIDAAALTGANYLVLPLTILSTVLVRRTLGPYAAGVLAAVSLMLSYASFAHMGVLTAAERELPYVLGKGESGRFDRIRTTAFTVVMLTAFIATPAVVVYTCIAQADDTVIRIALLIGGVTIIAQQFVYFQTVLLRTAREFVFLAGNQIAFGVLVAAISVIGAWLAGAPGVLGGTLAMLTVESFLLWRRTRFMPRMQFDWAEARRLAVIGIPMLIMGFAVTLLRTFDNGVVLRFLGAESLGLYTIALTANTIVFTVTNLLTTVIYPRLQQAYGSQETPATLSLYVERPSMIMAEVLPVLIGPMFFLVPIVVLLLLPSFEAGLPAFKIDVVGTYFFAALQMSSLSLVALNRQLRTAILLGLAVLVGSLSAWIFVNLGYGLAGVAAAAVFAYIVAFVAINGYALSHWMNVQAVLRFIGALAIPGVYTAAVLWFIETAAQGLGSGQDLLSFSVMALAKCALFMIAYLPVIALMEERTRLMREIVAPMVNLLGMDVAGRWRARVGR